LKREKVVVVELDAPDMRRACGYFYDSVTAPDTSIRVRTHPDLDRAVEGASKRETGDLWIWGRKSSRFDISPLVAATVALWALANPPDQRTPLASFA